MQRGYCYPLPMRIRDRRIHAVGALLIGAVRGANRHGREGRRIVSPFSATLHDLAGESRESQIASIDA
jgi:hypothetical protein